MSVPELPADLTAAGVRLYRFAEFKEMAEFGEVDAQTFKIADMVRLRWGGAFVLFQPGITRWEILLVGDDTEELITDAVNSLKYRQFSLI